MPGVREQSLGLQLVHSPARLHTQTHVWPRSDDLQPEFQTAHTIHPAAYQYTHTSTHYYDNNNRHNNNNNYNNNNYNTDDNCTTSNRDDHHPNCGTYNLYDLTTYHNSNNAFQLLFYHNFSFCRGPHPSHNKLHIYTFKC